MLFIHSIDGNSLKKCNVCLLKCSHANECQTQSCVSFVEESFSFSLWLVQPVKGMPKNVMLIGADVHHKKGNKSIIGFCATLNSSFSAFYSRAR